MPEGDTIWKTARTLRGVLAGRPVVRVRSSLPAIAALGARLALNGQSVRDVTATGKHLLIYFSSGAALHTHLGMHGSWHLYRPGTPWRKPAARANLVIEADHAIAVCFDASVVELLPPGAAGRHPALRRLGPDLLAPGFDSAEARGRLRVSGTTPIGVALLDQTALAGIGNVYKSEILFVCGVSPFAAVASLHDPTLDRLIATARALLSRNRGPGGRRTRSDMASEPLWVYGRAGRPCRRCGTAVRRVRQGEQQRSTYWCPTCQPPAPPN